jgi:hypothetical protein
MRLNNRRYSQGVAALDHGKCTYLNFAVPQLGRGELLVREYYLRSSTAVRDT